MICGKCKCSLPDDHPTTEKLCDDCKAAHPSNFCKNCKVPLVHVPGKKRKRRCDDCIKDDPTNGLIPNHPNFHNPNPQFTFSEDVEGEPEVPEGVLNYKSEKPETPRDPTKLRAFDEGALHDLMNKVINDYLDVSVSCDVLGLDTATITRHRAKGAEPNAVPFDFLVWNSLRYAEAEATRKLIKRSLSGDVVVGNQARDFLEKTHRRLAQRQTINVAYEVSAIASAVDHVIRANIGQRVTLDLLIEISDTINRLSSDAVILALDEKLLPSR